MNVFVWHELAVEKPEEVLGFYAGVFDATVNKKQIVSARDSYYILEKGNRWFSGIFKPDIEISAPMWYGIIRVDNLDDVIERVVSLGGEVLNEPVEENSIGRYVYAVDSCGARFSLVQFEHDLFPEKPNDGVKWNELLVYDAGRAIDFYGRAFGWKVVKEIDKPDGKYHVLSYDGNPENIFGGVISGEPADPGWRYYFHVDSLDETLNRVESLGGKVIANSVEIPGGRVASCSDPAGNTFYLFESRR